jgi:hypothetical protein
MEGYHFGHVYNQAGVAEMSGGIALPSMEVQTGDHISAIRPDSNKSL